MSKKITNPLKKKETLPNRNVVERIALKIVTHAKSKSRSDKVTLQFPNWYAGITYDIDIRVVGHKTKRKVTDLAHFGSEYAYTHANARAIEKYLCTEFRFVHCETEGNTNKDDHPRPSNRVYTYNIPKTDKNKK
jgi:hypothetical protein